MAKSQKSESLSIIKDNFLQLNDNIDLEGQEIIKKIFLHYVTTDSLLPDHYKNLMINTPKERIIADYISGMTDIFAKKEYLKLSK